MTVLAQKRDELAIKQNRLAAIFDEAGSDLDLAKVKTLQGSTVDKANEIKRLNSELGELASEIEQLALVERVAADVKATQTRQPDQAFSHAKPLPVAQPQPEQKTIGEMFVESATYKDRIGKRGPSTFVPDVDLKTLMTTAAGWAPENLRQPGFVPSAQYQPNIIDAIPFATTNQAAVIYMLESTFTNNAAGRAEGANNAGEAALVLTATTASIVEHAVWIPVTQEQMEDVSYVRQYVNQRLTLMLRQVMDAAIMTGAGAPSYSGLIGLANVNTQAKGADPVMDAIHKGLTACQVTGRANPNLIICHPNDWQDIRLTRTADGIYILGNPGDNAPKQLWGLPVITSTSCTENTAVAGDFANYCQLVQKRGIQFEYTDSHASLFIQRTLAVLASVRTQFVVYRPSAFCNVTGI